MLFNSVIFLFAFLPVTYLVFWRLSSAASRYVWLTVSGYVFYGYWDWRFCLLMAFSTLVSFGAGLGFLKWSDPDRHARQRRWCLVAPITVDLALLGFFKYANFGMETATAVLRLFGADVVVPHLNIVLPIGISFYTFHTISYIVDSYRGQIRPTRDLFEFAAYVSLFSQLVAGPIVRFRQLEADLEQLGSASRTRWLGRGISLFVIGLVEKVVVADTLAAFVDPTLSHYGSLSTVGAWVAMLAYSLQLYFDFSGYSTMAAGLGLMFGLRIPQNFNSPYQALDPSDFWRRWHISLSTCMRDYLYIPFGGNRRGELRTYVNLGLTMLIGGLWHGASWTFVIWGGYHGLLLAAHRKAGARWDALPRALRQCGMFVAAIIGWVFFRATDLQMAGHILTQMFTPTPGTLGLADDHLLALAGLLGLSGGWALLGPNPFEIKIELHRLTDQLLLTAASAAALTLILSSRNSPFLYFQF